MTIGSRSFTWHRVIPPQLNRLHFHPRRIPAWQLVPRQQSLYQPFNNARTNSPCSSSFEFTPPQKSKRTLFVFIFLGYLFLVIVAGGCSPEKRSGLPEGMMELVASDDVRVNFKGNNVTFSSRRVFREL
ncbi:hypothetical protein ES332_D08G235000v1 [Gossypium tomentosum]|uniref:Uncharacterized protein n=1 Tax=Gossypium tomentosum TaxID=34277 RepID=A0A5D2JYS2_GOSTO|nr:hypothetical protein ES332_D08G235000v1 [Gossypium tomentosum]